MTNNETSKEKNMNTVSKESGSGKSVPKASPARLKRPASGNENQKKSGSSRHGSSVSQKTGNKRSGKQTADKETAGKKRPENGGSAGFSNGNSGKNPENGKPNSASKKKNSSRKKKPGTADSRYKKETAEKKPSSPSKKGTASASDPSISPAAHGPKDTSESVPVSSIKDRSTSEEKKEFSRKDSQKSKESTPSGINAPLPPSDSMKPLSKEVDSPLNGTHPSDRPEEEKVTDLHTEEKAEGKKEPEPKKEDGSEDRSAKDKTEETVSLKPDPSITEKEPIQSNVPAAPTGIHHVISVREANLRNEKKTEKTGKSEAEKKAERKRGLPGRIMLWLSALVLVLASAAGFGGFMFYQSLLDNMPPLDISKREQFSQASTIYDRNGRFVAEYGTNENVEWADSSEIPQMLKDAFIAIEDERFYTHNGIDLKRLVGAVIGQITGNSSYGASTITQQLIKNTHLSQEVTYTRKAQEIHLAMELEKVMSKDDILVWYMNTLYLGDSNYGVKVAAKDYFGKDLSDLSLRECAILAGLAQSPNEYNPRLNMLKGDLTPTNRRISTVLYKMLDTGKINEEQYEAAMNSHLSVLKNSRRYKLYNYPIYVEYAVENVAEKLLKEEGTPVNDETLTEKKQWLRAAGYRIYTAFDPGIQDITQKAVTEFDKYPATVTGTEVEVSTVIMDHHTGEVVAMVGGREEPKEPEGFNRATDSTQAVGSSIKPLSVYAPACETGDYPGTTVLDVQQSIEGYGEDNSYPNGDHTGGAITMRKALELSHNIPAARFLLEHVGIDRAYDFMVKEGFAPENLAKTPAGLALGATDVTTLEMTAAYACLANGGEYIEPHAYTKVTDRFGTVMLSADKEIDTHRVFSKSTAWLVTDMMQSNMVEGYGVNARLTDVTSAGKTGTHEHQVISFGGYSPYYTSFVRISADDYVRMINSSSYYQSAGLWKAYMDPIHEGLADREIQDFTKESVGIQEYYVCTNSGMLAESWCAGHNEYAAPNNAPTEKCTGHTYGSGEGDWSEWTEESAIDYSDPEWYLHGWWDEEGNFHPE